MEYHGIRNTKRVIIRMMYTCYERKIFKHCTTIYDSSVFIYKYILLFSRFPTDQEKNIHGISLTAIKWYYYTDYIRKDHGEVIIIIDNDKDALRFDLNNNPINARISYVSVLLCACL